jgi:hypothetical protein
MRPAAYQGTRAAVSRAPPRAGSTTLKGVAPLYNSMTPRVMAPCYYTTAPWPMTSCYKIASTAAYHCECVLGIFSSPSCPRPQSCGLGPPLQCLPSPRKSNANIINSSCKWNDNYRNPYVPVYWGGSGISKRGS